MMQRCYIHTFVTIDKCGCPPDPDLTTVVNTTSQCPFCGTRTGQHGFSFNKDGKYGKMK